MVLLLLGLCLYDIVAVFITPYFTNVRGDGGRRGGEEEEGGGGREEDGGRMREEACWIRSSEFFLAVGQYIHSYFPRVSHNFGNSFM